MKYEDEEQSFSAAALARRQKYPSDIDSLLALHEESVVRAQEDALALLNLQRELRHLHAETERLRSDLKASRSEVQQLKAVLTKLRRSASLRLGKAILAPIRKVRPAGPVRSLKHPAPQTEERRTLEQAPVSPDPEGSGEQRTEREIRLEELLSDVRKEPSAANILRAVAHYYYVLGEIQAPAALIREHAAALESLDARGRRTTEAVLGQERLWHSGPDIAPRQPNAGYLVERGRVMYCAHSTGHFNSNGYSTRTAELVQGFLNQGADVRVIARPGYPWDVPVDQPKPPTTRFTRDVLGVEHVFTPGPSWSDQPLDRYWLEAADVYVREAQRARAAAIHSASNHVTALPALLAARRLGVPFSYEVRGLWEITEASEKPGWETSERYHLAKRLETLVATNADIVFAITEQVREELVLRGVQRDKIQVLPNGVDTDRFTPMPASDKLRLDLGLPVGVPVIGYAGSLVHYEGLSDLLSAAALLRDRDVDFHAVIVGDGPELPKLMAHAKSLGLGEQITFTGRVEATDVPAYVSIFDVMPCPRLRLPVTELVSPLKPLEAMAAGKAMVLTDLAPLREFAGADQERALLAEPADPESLADQLSKLLSNKALREELGRRARLWVVRSRQWGDIARTMSESFLPLLQGDQPELPHQRNLKQISVGVIADSFTTEGLRPEVHLTELLPGAWRDQLTQSPIDVLLVESAWEGVGGKWKQKVGYYDEERFSDLRGIIAFCNEQSIPTLFWNKEDPVHFNRFKRTAELFDHVFTTDSGCIERYAESSSRNRTVASLPFYAQPKLHNPLPTDYPYEHTVAYAGSYYGDRYPARSAELAAILSAAKPFGLAIYDRQHLSEDSPYRFPPSLGPFVRGGLPYLEMVKAYKAHPVHVNVNSVDASPTMFSRRVAEIAASGSVVLSGKGEGVANVMAGLVQTVANGEEAHAVLSRWMKNETVRLRDAWLGYRLIHRGHTAAHRLAYMLRCAGMVVRAPEPPRYAVRLSAPSPEALRLLAAQTIRPTVVIIPDPSAVEGSGLDLLADSEATPVMLDRLGIRWVGEMPGEGPDRTVFEDLLTAATYGEWSEIGSSAELGGGAGEGLLRYGTAPVGSPRLSSTGTGSKQINSSVVFRRYPGVGRLHAAQPRVSVRPRSNTNILIAGHDLKFASGIIRSLESQGHTVVLDSWQGHNQHDEELSRQKLSQADVVFTEWTLGNAVWYSKNLHEHQRLVSRFHSQELFTDYPKMIDTDRVEKFIFVGEHVKNVALRNFGLPPVKSVILPNPVEALELARPKADDARFTLGLVGIVPAQKGLGRALDLLAALRAVDPRYRLRIKGKRPEDYAWMSARPDEMSYYESQYRRIEADALLRGAVTFDGHGPDMSCWYRDIGVVLSVSDFESFHMTLADGGASGAVPVSLAWPGADQIYPSSWLFASVPEMVAYILTTTRTPQEWKRQGSDARSWVRAHLSSDVVMPALTSLILGDYQA
ncbi:glycosyltransferase [Arthrobacter koreensis]|uniref:glycosyltransferase n=1 Tax=Arthrobacter koreensis TaxID=199136 RepID=UPI0036DAD333